VYCGRRGDDHQLRSRAATDLAGHFVAALNIPLGIAVGLLGERLSRRAER
jgi:hypothetical protein